MRQPIRRSRGIPLRTLVPNAITVLALCAGLLGIRYGISGAWNRAAISETLGRLREEKRSVG